MAALQRGEDEEKEEDKKRKKTKKDGTLAQLVEQRTFNPLVGSSNLPRPTRTHGSGRKVGLFMRTISRQPELSFSTGHATV